jgi:K+-sensing histidine kinase KdpD
MHDQHYIDLTGGNGVQPCAMLGMPLLGRRSTLGVLFLDNTEHPEAFDEDDERLMQIFAGQVALWLERVRVMDTLSQKRDVARLAAELVHQLTGTIAGVPEVADEIKTEMARAPELHKAARLADELQRKATVVAQIGRWVDRFIRLDRMSLREFDVSELIIEVCQRLRERQPSNISIHPPQGDPALPLLRADRMLISVLLENLIENAFDAIPAGHCGQIDLNVEQHDEFFVIQMWDNGQGIPHENRKKIWEVGYSTKSRQGIKRGLGLTLCLRIVKAHDGNIQVDDSPTGGARFTIQLPVAGPQAQFEEDNVPV